MDVLLSKTGNTSPKWDVSTKKMGGSPECASFYAQKCPTKSKPYLRMMCARDQHLNSHKDFRFFKPNNVRIIVRLFVSMESKARNRLYNLYDYNPNFLYPRNKFNHFTYFLLVFTRKWPQKI